jgi:hypothetical protein
MKVAVSSNQCSSRNKIGKGGQQTLPESSKKVFSMKLIHTILKKLNTY